MEKPIEKNTGNGKIKQDIYEVNPVYTKTRRQKINKETLRRNKVVSLFQDDPSVDQMKILYTQILNRLQERGGNSVLVTSPGHGEGKTLTAVNLAISMSLKVDLTVLLVDADLRTPSINGLLGFNALKGLSEYLLREAEIPELLVNPDIAKLVVLPGGRSLPNSTELLGSPRMKELVLGMKSRYPERIIIFDCPPLLTSADTMVFSPFVDGVVLVVEAEKTTSGDVEKAMELLRGKPFLGTVLNKARS